MENDDKNTGLFGIPIKKPTPKELEELLNPPKKEIKRKEGFMYIPKLRLWVADEVSMGGENWHGCNYILHKKGSQMLTPAEFWIYYDYCAENREDIIRELKLNSKKEEWLNAIVNGKNELVINPYTGGGMWNYTGGDTYDDYPLKYLKQPQYRISNHETKYFERKDVHPKTGLPMRLGEKGEYIFWCNEERNCAVVRGSDLFDKHPHNFFLSLVYNLGEGNGRIGVRECRKKV